MKKILSIIVLMLFTLVVQAQISLYISCNDSFILTNKEIKDRITDLVNKSNTPILSYKDTADVVQINYLAIKPNINNNAIVYEINKSRSILYFPTKKKSFYRWQSNPYDLSMLSNEGVKNFFYPVMIALESRAKCIFLLELFPYHNYYETIYFIDSDENVKIFNDKLKIFNSIQEYLEYSFGSTENYIETYRKRIEMEAKWR